VIAANFIHLRVHTEFSLLDGLVRVKPLAKKIASMNMPSVAITDQSNLCVLVKFYKAAHSNGVKPLCGADIWLENPIKNAEPTQLTLLVQNKIGYQHLTKLLSNAYLLNQKHGYALVKREWIAENNEGLIALSGAQYGDVGRALLNQTQDEAELLIKDWMEIFPNRFYLEVQRVGREHEEAYIEKAALLAQKFDCPLVATNDVRFLTPEEFEAHEVRVCIHEGRILNDARRPKHYTSQQYLRTAEEMQTLFSDLPSAIENTVEIAKRCNLDLQLGQSFLPNYPIPDGMTLESFFEQQSHEGLALRFASIFDEADPEIENKKTFYRDRLNTETKTIIQMGFAGYFLIVMDFIRWAKNNDVPVGPGRGSGAGSLVAYSLQITDIDPIAYDLLFERFLNPERVSLPDFDIDFCMDGRDRVIDYVAETYGRDAVSQIITFGTMAAKGVIRDVARVQGKSYGLADKLSKMIPFEIGMTLEKAFEQEDVLRDFLSSDDEAQEIWDMAVQLEGVTRNAGKHAGGVVIAPSRLVDFSPLYCDEAGNGVVTQFDKDDVEAVGLVKFDFLGLRTLTIIDWAIKAINANLAASNQPLIDITKIPLNDEATFALLKHADTTAVFQLESRGMKDLIKRLQPSCFEDIIALVALFRPGPLQSGMVDDFIDRKHGKQAVSYPHPDLQPILQNTFGVIVYQEQVMQIAQVLAGYTLGSADLLRRAMGKKKPEEMAKQRTTFVEGAVAHGVKEKKAADIFDLMEKFAEYGFNKSHSAAYALLAYQTAWLKAHFPAQFMAAVLSADMNGTDKVVTMVEECRRMKLNVLPPDVNYGEFKFTVNDEGHILYGLGAIKGVGEGAIDSIVRARNEDGQFKNMFDFCLRVDYRSLNKRVMEALVRSGALDHLGPEGVQADIHDVRATLFASIDEAVKAAEQNTSNEAAGMLDLFATGTADAPHTLGEFVHAKPWNSKERLLGEKETLGLYLTGHPIEHYEEELRYFVKSRLADLRAGKETQAAAGLVVDIRIKPTKSGGKIAFVTLDDRTGRMDVAVYTQVFEQYRDCLRKDAMLVVEGVVEVDEYSDRLRIRASKVLDMVQARENYVRGLILQIDSDNLPDSLSEQLQSLLKPFCGDFCPVLIDYETPTEKARLKLGAQWRVKPTDELIARLRDKFGKDKVKLTYN
jgi:DNA polymerase-3 subunit alpha